MSELKKDTFLYKLEAELAEARYLTVIVVSSSDDKAFDYAENNILRHTVAPPDIRSLSIVEKKPLGRNGVGYIVETLKFD